MKYQLLGKSSLEVSQIGFGCMSLGNDKKQNEYLLNRAVELGINFFDTADLYNKGMNESVVGEVLRSNRQYVKIATKVGNQWREDGSGWDWNPRKEYILTAIDKSLSRLKTDFIDLYQLHGGTLEDPIDETIEAFEILIQQGKIRYYGISSIRPNVIRAYVARSNIVSVMMQYSLLDRRPEESCFAMLKENNVGVLTRGSIAQGLLVNKEAKSYLNYSTEEVKAAADAVKHLSKDRSASQTALSFVLQNENVTSAIVGLRTPEQLHDAIKALEVPALSPSDTEYLREAVKPNFYEQHR